jgi:hypothetical protein
MALVFISSLDYFIAFLEKENVSLAIERTGSENFGSQEFSGKVSNSEIDGERNGEEKNLLISSDDNEIQVPCV